MTKPQLKAVPREGETKREEWKSDAERLNLPTTNVRDSGAPVLDREKVLRRADVGRLVGRR